MSSAAMMMPHSKLRNARRWVAFSPLQAFSGALAVTLAAFIVRLALHPVVEPHLRFQFFFVACVVAEYFFGLAPAVLSMLLGTALGMYFFVQPYNTLTPVDMGDVVTIASFVSVSLFVILTIEYLRRSQYSQQLLRKVAESRHLLLMHRDNERLYSGRRNRKVLRQVERVLGQLDRARLLMSGDDTRAANDDWLAAVHPDDRPTLLRALDVVRNGGEPEQRVALRLRAPDGHEDGDEGGGYRGANWSMLGVSIGPKRYVVVLDAGQQRLAQADTRRA
jgi:K+-sensing histidine kinase KdpD